MTKGTPPLKTKKRGRAKLYASAAERQRAYRARLRDRGLRVQTRVVREPVDRIEPLRSEIIDLSACRQW